MGMDPKYVMHMFYCFSRSYLGAYGAARVEHFTMVLGLDGSQAFDLAERVMNCFVIQCVSEELDPEIYTGAYLVDLAVSAISDKVLSEEDLANGSRGENCAVE